MISNKAAIEILKEICETKEQFNALECLVDAIDYKEFVIKNLYLKLREEEKKQ